MSTRKFLYVDLSGDYTESLGAFETSDFISVSAGVTDAGKPIKTNASGVIDIAFVPTSGIDHNQLLNTHNLTTNIDHGSISGLGDDDHTIYVKADGTRQLSNILSYSGANTFVASHAIVDKAYVDSKVAAAGTASEWQTSCKSSILTPPVTPAAGDRYLINGTGAGTWTGHNYAIAEFDGSVWTFITPTSGTFCGVDDDPNYIYYFGGTGPWIKKGFEATTASNGVIKVGSDLQANLLVSGGLKLVSQQLCIEPLDIVGEGLKDDGSDNLAIDWSTAYNDSKAIKASELNSVLSGKGAALIGINDAGNLITAVNVEGALQENRGAIDALEDNQVRSPNATLSVGGTFGADTVTVDINWSTAYNDSKAIKASDLNNNTNGRGAALIGIEDAGSYTSVTNVELALQELYAKVIEFGTVYTVGTGGVAKGDLVFISANNTIRKLDVTTNSYAIGIAAATASASATVKTLGNDTVITGVLSGATAGTKYYWTNTGWSSTRPATSGTYVWVGGIAKNATDLQVEVGFVMRNA